jgi:3-phenylpropionate/trans-cinnamate dioxygenase ferredoxin subunit
MQYRVCHVQEIPRGEKRNYIIKNVPVVVVHSQQDEFYAIYGLCPHHRGPLGAGVLGGLTEAAQPGETFQYVREGEVLRCPWHSFSFDVTTGACLTVPEKLRVKTYPLTISDHEVFLDM